MMRLIIPTVLAAIALASPLSAQLSVPGVPVGIPPVGDIVGDVTQRVDDTLQETEQLTRQAERLLRERERTLSQLLRQHPERIERDAAGNLARRGELLALDLSTDSRANLEAAGFQVLGEEEIDGLGLAAVRLAVPRGQSLEAAEKLARGIAAEAEIVPDNLFLQSGFAAAGSSASIASSAATTRIATEVGMIDGAPGPATRVLASKGFAAGAPDSSDHGSAVASLLSRAGVARIRAADVYGSDPAGGNSLAIAKALGWLTASGSKVVTISLVGPRNALLERAVKSAQSKGVVVVAAVGNDGPAAPPAYPASYDDVVAVTGVDGKRRALIEAGRALNLDYAAPGADVYALDMRGRMKKWRGTSFATPLAAARLAAALDEGGNWRTRLDREARDLGPKGPDKTYGRGLLCEGCAKPVRGAK